MACNWGPLWTGTFFFANVGRSLRGSLRRFLFLGYEYLCSALLFCVVLMVLLGRRNLAEAESSTSACLIEKRKIVRSGLDDER
jgi:hypothetical protein